MEERRADLLDMCEDAVPSADRQRLHGALKGDHRRQHAALSVSQEFTGLVKRIWMSPGFAGPRRVQTMQLLFKLLDSSLGVSLRMSAAIDCV